MKKINLLPLLLAVLSLVSTFNLAIELPEGFQPCKFKDEKCIVDLFKNHLFNYKVANNAANLNAIDPMQVPAMDIEFLSTSTLDIDLYIEPSILKGLKEAKLIHAYGFGSDMTEQKELVFLAKHVHIRGDFSVSGKFLFFSISGDGTQVCTATDLQLRMKFKGKPQKRGDDTYMTIQNFSLSISAKDVNYEFENIYSNSNMFSEKAKDYVSENSEEVWDKIRPRMEEGIKPKMKKFLNDAFATLPYDEMLKQ